MSLTNDEGRIEYKYHHFDATQGLDDQYEVLNDFGGHGWKVTYMGYFDNRLLVWLMKEWPKKEEQKIE
jgi:hypothetical protein